MSNNFNNTDFLIQPAFADKDSYTVVFTPDNNYVPYFAVALQSLIINSKPNEFYDIVVFEEDISERNKRLIYSMLPENFSLRFFDIGNFIRVYLDGVVLKSMRYWSVSMYYRIFIPFVMQKYERVMYADSDVCFNHNLEEFYKTDFDGKEILAVKDTISPIIANKEPKRYNLYKNYGIEIPEHYFNSGILLFNLKAIVLSDYSAKLKSALSVPVLMFPDQDILNIVFYGKTKSAPMKWNCQYALSFESLSLFMSYSQEYREEYIETIKNPSIIHYTSSTKPWNAPKEKTAEIFWRFARMTPFYEEIMYTNLISCLKKLHNRWYTFLKYWLYKMLSHLTFGNIKKHYKAEKSRQKALLKEILAILQR